MQFGDHEEEPELSNQAKESSKFVDWRARSAKRAIAYKYAPRARANNWPIDPKLALA
jgi:hypothetical protein